MGPTAAGKTSLAVDMVERYPVDLISVDSALVYRGMDIGTAKPDPATLRRAPHRLIDIRDPWQPYSAAEFVADARREIDTIHAAGRIPLLVGGTMLYFRALRQGLAPMPAADPAVRQTLEQQAADKGWAHLHQRLAEVDPASAARIHPTDPQRIQRALEVHAITGTSLTEWHQAQPQHDLKWDVLTLVVNPKSRATLHQRIARRFEQMLEQGFIEEVRALRQDTRIHADLPSMRAVGYRQVWHHLDGQYGRAEMVERGVIATRQLAKRQITWLRKETDATWIEDGNLATIGELVDTWVTNGSTQPG